MTLPSENDSQVWRIIVQSHNRVKVTAKKLFSIKMHRNGGILEKHPRPGAEFQLTAIFQLSLDQRNFLLLTSSSSVLVVSRDSP